MRLTLSGIFLILILWKPIYFSYRVLFAKCSAAHRLLDQRVKSGLRAKRRFLRLPVKRHLKTKKDFCGNHCRKSPMRSIDDGGPAALHNVSDQARCNPATLYPASKNDHQPPQRNNRSCLVPLDSSHATIITH